MDGRKATMAVPAAAGAIWHVGNKLSTFAKQRANHSQETWEQLQEATSLLRQVFNSTPNMTRDDLHSLEQSQAGATSLSMAKEEVKEVLYQMEFKAQHQSEQFIHQARRVPELTDALKLVCTSLIGERQLHQNAKDQKARLTLYLLANTVTVRNLKLEIVAKDEQLAVSARTEATAQTRLQQAIADSAVMDMHKELTQAYIEQLRIREEALVTEKTKARQQLARCMKAKARSQRAAAQAKATARHRLQQAEADATAAEAAKNCAEEASELHRLRFRKAVSAKKKLQRQLTSCRLDKADIAQARQAAEEEAERLQLENNNLKQTAAITTAEVAELRLKADEASTVIADLRLTAHEADAEMAEMRGAAQQASTAHAKLQADLACAKTSAALWKEKATFTTAASSGPVDKLWREKCADLEKALRKKAVACDRAEQSAARRLQRLDDAHADKEELMEYCRVSDCETANAKRDGRQSAAGMTRKLKQKEDAYLALHQEYHAVLEAHALLQVQCNMLPPFSEEEKNVVKVLADCELAVRQRNRAQDELKQALASKDALKKRLRHLQNECHSTCSLSDYAMRNNSNLRPRNASVLVPKQQCDSVTVSASAAVPNKAGDNGGRIGSSNSGLGLHHAHATALSAGKENTQAGPSPAAMPLLASAHTGRQPFEELPTQAAPATHMATAHLFPTASHGNLLHATSRNVLSIEHQIQSARLTARTHGTASAVVTAAPAQAALSPISSNTRKASMNSNGSSAAATPTTATSVPKTTYPAKLLHWESDAENCPLPQSVVQHLTGFAQHYNSPSFGKAEVFPAAGVQPTALPPPQRTPPLSKRHRLATSSVHSDRPIKSASGSAPSHSQ